jgi:peptidoglycan/xylan/chitin deacetylase (PgdA/CDA1 family)
MNGISSNNFGAGSCLTREQSALLLYRIFSGSLANKKYTGFSDYAEVSAWAHEAVAVLAGNGIIAGFDDGSFRPKKVITRAEFIAYLDRLAPSPGKVVISGIDKSVLPVFERIDLEQTLRYDSLMDKKLVALTFDDGPHQTLSPKLLDILKEEGIVATFFVQGKRVNQYPEIVKRAVNEGHQVANHTHNHKQLTSLSKAAMQKEIQDSAAAIEAATGIAPTLMRPPYGAVNSNVKAYAGTPIILWSVDPQDWRHTNANTTYNTVTSKAGDGSIILLHETVSSTVSVISRIIRTMRDNGFAFVTVDELIQLRGPAEAGVVYNSFPK